MREAEEAVGFKEEELDMKSSHSHGFSLIGLMIVVLIIGILAAIAIPDYIAMVNRAKEGSVKANCHSTQLVVEDFAVRNNGTYPTLKQIQDVSLWTGGVLPNNPFTGEAMTIVAAGYSQGNVGYQLKAGVYTIEGYGKTATSGPAGDGIVIILTNG
ncbi:MAG: prepilin-type N-terminal cleavage/methylation domain-containing protein [Patescibacteria group bacterium]|nr:prepilin-type N-terminal cleavage/methylation domain-containing protein [Patescibacteria group bacterium]